jgi:acyl-CoA synthetase (AMP-forming)/AMP-acid ligase II
MILKNGMHDNAVLLEDVESRRLTKGELLGQMDRIVGDLNSAGYRRNDRFALALQGGFEMVVSLISIASGFTAIPLNPCQTAFEYERYMANLRLRAFVTDSALESPAKKVAEDLGLELIEISSSNVSGEIISLTGFEPNAKGEPVFAMPDDVANVLLTSGTTSKPKHVPWTHSMICWGAHISNSFQTVIPSDRSLIIDPLFHASGVINIYRPLYAGAVGICAPGYRRPEFFKWLDRTRPTTYTAPPAIQLAILETAKENRDIIKRLNFRLIRCGSSRLPPTAMKGLEEAFDTPVVENYSSTEAIGIGRGLFKKGWQKAGLLIIQAQELEIIDSQGNKLQKDELGEIVVKGPNVFKGYEDDPEENSRVFIKGWYKTGDLGFIDADGYLHLSGRVKEVINKGGEKVAPQEVDQVLMEHPAVAEAIAFPIPHPTLREDINAAVVLKEGHSVTEAELRKLLFERLTYFKVPTRIFFVKEIPKGSAGKANRLEMARLLGLVG